MIDKITEIFNEELNKISEWALSFFFTGESAGTGQTAFSSLLNGLTTKVFSFDVVFVFIGVFFIIFAVRLLFDIVRILRG